MSGEKINAAIVGASGYSGEELVRLLLGHPHVNLSVLTSRQYAGQAVTSVFPRFAGHAGASALTFSEPSIDLLADKAQAVFLALPHGVAAEFAVPLAKRGGTVIDLSADFRLNDADTYNEFYGTEHPAPEWLPKAVYGLPEIRRDAIANATLIASPGCYPTSILLPTIPLLEAGLIDPEQIIADSLSGVSGAGRKADVPFLYVECNESLRPYGVPKHRHLSEIEQELSLANGSPVTIQFTPHLVPVNRGILTTLYLAPAPGQAAARLMSAKSRTLSNWPSTPRSWLTSKSAAPFSRHVSRIRPSDSVALVGSRLPVGSSASTNLGRLARARATATRCCWPVESWRGK